MDAKECSKRKAGWTSPTAPAPGQLFVPCPECGNVHLPRRMRKSAESLRRRGGKARGPQASSQPIRGPLVPR